jgi:hypothetical protein
MARHGSKAPIASRRSGERPNEALRQDWHWWRSLTWSCLSRACPSLGYS